MGSSASADARKLALLLALKLVTGDSDRDQAAGAFSETSEVPDFQSPDHETPSLWEQWLQLPWPKDGMETVVQVRPLDSTVRIIK